MATNRLGRNMVALAASAITAVYAAGYIHTQSADAALSDPVTAPSAAVAPASAQPTGVTTTNPAAAASASRSGPSLKDGTFSGMGTSRRGDVQVALTVQGGRIADVKITGASTQYPTRFIANLPGQVVSRQSAQVDVVGGATYSSLAFRGAVQQALQRAQA